MTILQSYEKLGQRGSPHHQSSFQNWEDFKEPRQNWPFQGCKLKRHAKNLKQEYSKWWILLWEYYEYTWSNSCKPNGKRGLLTPGVSRQWQQFRQPLGLYLNQTLWLKLQEGESLPTPWGRDPGIERNSVSEEQHLWAETNVIWLLITATEMPV